jgi:hypothetical protein
MRIGSLLPASTLLAPRVNSFSQMIMMPPTPA